MAIILDGNKLAKKIKEKIKGEIEQTNVKPGLAVVIVGSDPASKIYVKKKETDCKQCGIHSEEFALKEDIGQEKLLSIITELNERDDIHGILVQLPLPKGYVSRDIIQAICQSKDVDAFSYNNIGRIMVGDNHFIPCTPYGIIELLDHYKIPLKGKHCVIVNHSNIVGKPMAMLLLQREATVSICHMHTTNLAKITKEADILITAAGVPDLIKADMVKQDAVVIDVAINRLNGKICGDVDFDNVANIASHITPVPGGVGPMTRAMLMVNTLMAASKKTSGEFLYQPLGGNIWN